MGLAQAFETAPLPDALTRLAIARMVEAARRRLEAAGPDVEAAFAAAMSARPIAEHPEAANDQHYELPPRFFELVLGPRRKYSCGFYERPRAGLAEAEEAALSKSAAMARLEDGQDILELGCGWGSLTLWMAERFPRAMITAVSNAHAQRRHIEAQACRRGLSNVRVITCDMNRFEPEGWFDRIVSVEMFEHMANWRALLTRARDWLRADGRLFVHVFTHRATPYRFEAVGRRDWIAEHFFTGGMMPSRGLIGRFPELFTVEAEDHWNGGHYARTAEAWLANYDANLPAIEAILQDVYGPDARLWRRRWRLFFLAVAGLFGSQAGEAWGVSQYRLRPAA
jgi:cyclopropane-fatty-acyl-phospholipid synthase